MPDPVAVGEYPGVSVAYYEEPYRKYTVNGEDAVSVTTALGVLNKAALPNWAAKITREGCWELIRKDRSTRYLRRKWGDHFDAIVQSIGGGATASDVCAKYQIEQRDYIGALGCIVPADPITGVEAYAYMLPRGRNADLGSDLRLFGLRHIDSTKAAADRGVDVHQVWEDWNERQQIPDASKYPKDRRGYLRAMAKMIRDHEPECLESEKVVGSAVHGFAGRLDTVVVLRVDKRVSMVDVKTSKAVYPNSHFPQLAGYEIARRECGLIPTDRQGILRLGSDGEYELAWSDAEPEDFLAVLGAYKSQARWARR